MAEIIIENIKKFDEEYVKITNSLLRSIADESISTFDINSFFKNIAFYAANQINNIKLVGEIFNIDEREMELHKKGYELLVDELDKTCSLVNEEPYEIVNLSMFLIYWADINIFRHNQALLKQISLIDSGSSPKYAYEIINFKDADLTLTRAFNTLISKILDKTEKLTNTNRSIKVNLQDVKDKLTKMEEKAFSIIDPITDLPNRSKALELLQDLIPNGVAVFIISMTSYKDMVSTKGLDSTDTTLLAVVNSIKNLVRSDDSLFSTKKGELMLISPKLNETGAINIANSILSKVHKDEEVIRKLRDYDKLHLNIGISISNTTSTVSDMLQEADNNLKQAIKNGPNKFVI